MNRHRRYLLQAASGVIPAFAPQAETAALVASFANAPTDKRVRGIDRVIKALKAGGVWAKATGLWLPSYDEDSALKNWISPGTHDLVKHGTPTLTVDSDWLANANGDYLDTGIKLTDLNWTNVSFGFWTYDATLAANTSDLGATHSTNNYGLSLVGKNSTTSNDTTGRFGGASVTWVSAGKSPGTGLYGVSRLNASTFDAYHNGVYQQSASSANQTLGTESITFLALNVQGNPAGGHSARHQTMWFIGEALTADEWQCLTAAVGDFLEYIKYGEVDIYPQGVQPAVVEADFVAYGLTSQSIFAALQATRGGMSVAICGGWRDQNEGGMSSGGLGRADIYNTDAIAGLPKYVLDQVYTNKTGGGDEYDFEPNWWKRAIRAILDPAKNGGFEIPVYWSNGVSSVEKTGTKISSFKTDDGRSFVAKQYFDGSYEGDLMIKAGVSWTYGREAAGTSAEAANGYRGYATDLNSNAHQLEDADGTLLHIDPWLTPGDSSSGLIPEIKGVLAPYTTALNDQPAAGTADQRVQAYGFRLTMTTDGKRIQPFPNTPPPGYDASRYEALLRWLEVAPDQTLAHMTLQINIAGTLYDVNAGDGFTLDLDGGSWDYPAGSYAEREAIWEDHWNYTLGWWYTLQYLDDDRVPSALRTSALTWGLVRDHYWNPYPGDMIGQPPQLYVREAARMVSDAVINGNDAMGTDGTDPRISKNIVAVASYGFDSHPAQHIAHEYAEGQWEIWNEGGWENMSTGGTDQMFPVPFEVCVPKTTECTNLGVGFCVSATHVAFGAIRMELTAMQIGQSMGAAAAIAGDGRLQSVAYSDLTAALTDETHWLTGETAPYLQLTN